MSKVRPLPVEIPEEAPVHVGAAAVAMAYAIEGMSMLVTNPIAPTNVVAMQLLGDGDRCVTTHRCALAEAGWRLEMCPGPERAWRVVSR